MACTASADCQVLGESYRCETGVCRKGKAICPKLALPAGDQVRELSLDGATRSYTLHVPSGYSGSTPVPLMLDFHPMDLGLAWERTNSGYEALSDREGFILVWPEGLENTWNIGPCCTTSKSIDDFAFARTIVRQVSLEACVDPGRVYAVGFSMGGAMAHYLACRQSEVFAAVASSGMDLLVDSALACEPSRAIAEISFRGAADTVVPYAGGTTSPPGHPEMSFEVLGAVGTFQKWASLDRCTGNPIPSDATGCSTYSTCESGTEVTLCTIEGQGQVMGDANIAWELLKRHRMP